MRKNDHITGSPRQVLFPCDKAALEKAGEALSRGLVSNTFAEDRNVLGAAASSLRAILGEVDRHHAEERRAQILNVFEFDGADDRELALQRYALKIRGRFADAEWVDCICSLFGWRFLGLGPVDFGLDDDHVDRGAAFEWLRDGDDEHVVRFELGDEPELLVSEDSGCTWRVIEKISDLADNLGNWREADGHGASTRGAA